MQQPRFCPELGNWDRSDGTGMRMGRFLMVSGRPLLPRPSLRNTLAWNGWSNPGAGCCPMVLPFWAIQQPQRDCPSHPKAGWDRALPCSSAGREAKPHLAGRRTAGSGALSAPNDCVLRPCSVPAQFMTRVYLGQPRTRAKRNRTQLRKEPPCP